MESTKSSSGQNTWRNAASLVTSHSCIPNPAITSSRMGRSAAQPCISPEPGEQIEVDWPGDPDTGEPIPAFLFVGVMTYSQYPYVDAFINAKQHAWITVHVHMYEYFGGVTHIQVPDNTKPAVVHNNDWHNQELNTVYHEIAEHYGTAIIPDHVRAPKDKPDAEGSVGVVSTWITTALRDEQFFSLAELNKAIRKRLDESPSTICSKRKRVPDTRSSATKNCIIGQATGYPL